MMRMGDSMASLLKPVRSRGSGGKVLEQHEKLSGSKIEIGFYSTISCLLHQEVERWCGAAR